MPESTKANLASKLLILIACFLTLIQVDFQLTDIALVLLVTFTSLLLEYRRSKVVQALAFCGTLMLSLFIARYVFFLPVIFFDYLEPKKKWTLGLCLLLSLALLVRHRVTEVSILVTCGFIVLVSLFLKVRLVAYVELKSKYESLEQSSERQQFILTKENSNLIDKQNLNLSLGISNERNRIARDIHDNVGHLLSSAMIQLGAINVLNQDIKLQEPLALVSQTVEEGMENIRQSVHELHDESLNLKHSIEHIIDNLHGQTVSFRYLLTSTLDNQLKIDFLMIVREALANSMKYSNGTQIKLDLVEQPGFYRLLIQDNGTGQKAFNPTENGIGILSMKKRMSGQCGRLTAEQTAQGFRVLAIVPKNRGGN